ncbi:MAG TPA: choice-of-anchor D domain-containing protein [Actinophytocola sp.]|uniref:choice-of-anchor D domain-containing protein n=1 Tax=Actinophytocola sp. TaxID=1872138 RepID=UPI002DDD5061|nr:choice-of-anchor D domain-containing protein [Actinophytocola sp.]HEV2783576.1 choice-of-anchor D domain-containing protein [Actinophytocola sp.]
MVAASVAALLVSSAATPPAGAVAAPGSTQRASVKDPGQIGEGTDQSPNGGHDSVLSADGNAVAFVSNGKLDNLDPGAGESRPYSNVYVRDLARNRTVMISRGQFVDDNPYRCYDPGEVGLRSANPLNLNGPQAARLQQQPTIRDTPPDSDSFSPSISADGRFVSFLTNATNIFVEDCYSDSEIVVADRDPDGDGDFDENRPDGSRDYRYFRIAQSESDIGSYEYARDLKMSANATRLVWIEGGEGCCRAKTVGLKLPTGQTGLPVEVPSGPDNTNENVWSQYDPAISADGNHIVLHVTLIFCECDLVHAIVSTDMRTNETTRVDIDGGQPISTEFLEFVMRPAISADGTVIAFVAEQFESAVEGPAFSKFDEPNVYVVNVDYSRPPDQRVVRTTIASRDNNGNLINGELPGLSSDGRYLAFTTDNLAAHDGSDGNTTAGSCLRPPPPEPPRLAGEPLLDLNAAALPPERKAPRTNCQVVVRDLILDQARLVAEQPRLPGTLASPNQNGNAGNGNTVPSRFNFPPSTPPSLASDGHRIAFDSRASDLVPADTNQRDDVFVRTLEPTLRAVPALLDFDEVEIGQPAPTLTVRLEEVGAGPLFVETVEVIVTNPLNPPDFEIIGTDCQGIILHQTEGCDVTVAFGPTAVGARQGQLRVRPRGGRDVIVELQGDGTARPVPPDPVPRGPEFSASPSPLDFGERLVLSRGPESTVTVTNPGETPLRINSVAPVGPGAPGDYTVTANTCVGQVPAGGQCLVSVRFSPAEPGERTAALRFDAAAPVGTRLVGLRGTASPLSIEVNPGVSPPGRVTTVTGKGFPPGKSVTVTFDPQRPGQTTATVGPDGTFRASLLVFPKASPENRTVVATVDGSPALQAKDTLLIVFPSVNPADFVVRG